MNEKLHGNEGRVFPTEHKEKISKAQRGVKNSHSHPVINTRTKEIYPTVKEAAIKNGYTPNKLRLMLNGHNKNTSRLRYYSPKKLYMEGRTLRQIQLDVVQGAMNYYGNHQGLVAKQLGIGRMTLYRMLKEIADVSKS